MSDLPGNWKDALAEVERLRQEVFELKIYRGFGQDHGHERCVAEIARLRGLLKRLEWSGHKWRGEPGVGSTLTFLLCCPVCQGSDPDHREGCWLADALAPERKEAPPRS
jgi:hypothetical protein